MTRNRRGLGLGLGLLMLPMLSFASCLPLLGGGCTSAGNFDHKITLEDGTLGWDVTGHYDGSLDLDVLGVLDKPEAEGDASAE